MNLADLRSTSHAVWTQAQVADLLGCDYRTVGRACDDGTLPSIKLGRRVVIPTARLLTLLAGDAGEINPIPGKGMTPNDEDAQVSVLNIINAA